MKELVIVQNRMAQNLTTTYEENVVLNLREWTKRSSEELFKRFFAHFLL